MFEIQCPHCDKNVELEDGVFGLFDCPHCDEEFAWEMMKMLIIKLLFYVCKEFYSPSCVKVIIHKGFQWVIYNAAHVTGNSEGYAQKILCKKWSKILFEYERIFLTEHNDD